jgi:predicted DNA-binding WGR domain protein
MIRLVCTENGASKFWEGSIDGDVFTARFGKIGSAGQTKAKRLKTAAAAAKELEKLAKEKRAKGYVAAPAAAAGKGARQKSPPPSVTKPKKATASTDKRSRFPFLFYGVRPLKDWADGAKEYRMRFRAVPNNVARAAIQDAFRLAIEGSQIKTAIRWEWTKDWALLSVDEPLDDEARFDHLSFFSAMSDALLRVHEVAPLLEVSNLSAKAFSENAWEKWSLQQQARPSPAPSFGGRYSLLFNE